METPVPQQQERMKIGPEFVYPSQILLVEPYDFSKESREPSAYHAPRDTKTRVFLKSGDFHNTPLPEESFVDQLNFVVVDSAMDGRKIAVNPAYITADPDAPKAGFFVIQDVPASGKWPASTRISFPVDTPPRGSNIARNFVHTSAPAEEVFASIYRDVPMDRRVRVDGYWLDADTIVLVRPIKEEDEQYANPQDKARIEFTSGRGRFTRWAAEDFAKEDRFRFVPLDGGAVAVNPAHIPDGPNHPKVGYFRVRELTSNDAKLANFNASISWPAGGRRGFLPLTTPADDVARLLMPSPSTAQSFRQTAAARTGTVRSAEPSSPDDAREPLLFGEPAEEDHRFSSGGFDDASFGLDNGASGEGSAHHLPDGAPSSALEPSSVGTGESEPAPDGVGAHERKTERAQRGRNRNRTADA
jgi:hypothetical protein